MKKLLNPVCGPLTRKAPEVVGSPTGLVVVFTVTAGWLVTGPIFDWSGNWLLIPATITSVGAFLVVFLLQYSQNRDTRAIQLKLDELIRSLGDARTHLVRLENLSDAELDELEHEFRKLRDEAA